MKDDWNEQLQTLFSNANIELEGESFTGRTISKTRRFRTRLTATFGSLVLVLLVAVWILNIPFLGLAQQVSQLVTITLFDLGDGWLAFALTPVNNIASLVILSIKAMRIIRRKYINTAYVS